MDAYIFVKVVMFWGFFVQHVFTIFVLAGTSTANTFRPLLLQQFLLCSLFTWTVTFWLVCNTHDKRTCDRSRRCTAPYQRDGGEIHAAYLVGYERGDPVFPPVGVDEDVLLPPQRSGSGPGCDGLLEGLIEKLGSWGHTDRVDGWLSSFTVDVYLEWARLGEEVGGDTQSLQVPV